MQKARSDENAPGLKATASPEEIDAWMQVDPPGIRTQRYADHKRVFIKYDLPDQNRSTITILGGVTIIGSPFAWTWILIVWFQKKGYETIIVEPFDFPSALTKVAPVEMAPGIAKGYTEEEFNQWKQVAPGLCRMHSDKEFARWMQTDPVISNPRESFKTLIDEDNKSVTFVCRRLSLNPGGGYSTVPWPWVYLRQAWFERKGYRVIIQIGDP